MAIKLLNQPDAGTNRILNVVDPVNPQDAATKLYVDTRTQSSARISTTSSFTTTETVLSASKLYAANTILVGTTIRLVAHGSCICNTPFLLGTVGTWNARVRMGVNDSTADGILTDSGAITAGANGTSYFELAAELTCLTTGTGATFQGHFTVVNSIAGGITPLSGFVVLATPTAGNTTVANYVNLTLVSANSQVSFVVYSCTSQLVVA